MKKSITSILLALALALTLSACGSNEVEVSDETVNAVDDGETVAETVGEDVTKETVADVDIADEDIADSEENDKAEIYDAVDAYFKVAVEGLGKETWYKSREEYTLSDIVDENEELLLKVAPEEEWLSYVWVYDPESWKKSAETFIGYFYDYKMPAYNYNAGIDFELSYEINACEKMDDEDFTKTISALEQASMVHEDSVTDGYSLTVKYMLNGSDGSFENSGEYAVVKTDGVWRVFLRENIGTVDFDGSYVAAEGRAERGCYWDFTLQSVLSNKWHP